MAAMPDCGNSLPDRKPWDRDLAITGYNRTLPVRLLVGLGKLLSWLLPLCNRSGLFFFFPFCHVGGAEKVHAAIVRCFEPERPWVFFTKRSANHSFLPLFGDRGWLFDVWPLLKYGYPVSVGVMAGLVNRHPNAVVFGCNSLFYYLMLPYLRPEVRRIDLMHAFGGGSEHFSLPVAAQLDARVAINAKSIEDFREQYRKAGLPDELAQRLVLIENCVQVPEKAPVKNGDGPLQLLYVGRGSEEKRVHLVGRIASRCRALGIPAEVVVVGDAAAAVEPADRANCRFLGEVADADELAAIYDRAHLLLVTSRREGFPMVIMEAMARGVVPVATAVGGIPKHVRQGETGWLVEAVDDEARIVEEMCAVAAKLAGERELLKTISAAAHIYARRHFGGESFCSAYRSLLLAPLPQEGI